MQPHFFQFLKFIQQMCSILNIEAITADIGMDMSFESILSRCEQLIRAEYDWGEDKKLQLHNQTRKIKALKEQLQSKELHLDLLRKKVMDNHLHIKNNMAIMTCPMKSAHSHLITPLLKLIRMCTMNLKEL